MACPAFPDTNPVCQARPRFTAEQAAFAYASISWYDVVAAPLLCAACAALRVRGTRLPAHTEKVVQAMRRPSLLFLYMYLHGLDAGLVAYTWVLLILLALGDRYMALPLPHHLLLLWRYTLYAPLGMTAAYIALDVARFALWTPWPPVEMSVHDMYYCRTLPPELRYTTPPRSWECPVCFSLRVERACHHRDCGMQHRVCTDCMSVSAPRLGGGFHSVLVCPFPDCQRCAPRGYRSLNLWSLEERGQLSVQDGQGMLPPQQFANVGRVSSTIGGVGSLRGALVQCLFLGVDTPVPVEQVADRLLAYGLPREAKEMLRRSTARDWVLVRGKAARIVTAEEAGASRPPLVSPQARVFRHDEGLRCAHCHATLCRNLFLTVLLCEMIGFPYQCCDAQPLGAAQMRAAGIVARAQPRRALSIVTDTLGRMWRALSAPQQRSAGHTVPCPACGLLVQRISGCNHMTHTRALGCVRETHFCYACGKERDPWLRGLPGQCRC